MAGKPKTRKVHKEKLGTDTPQTYGIAPGRGRVSGMNFSRIAPKEMFVVYGVSDEKEAARQARQEARASRKPGNAGKTRRNNKRKNENAARLIERASTMTTGKFAGREVIGTGKPNGAKPLGYQEPTKRGTVTSDFRREKHAKRAAR